jgi:hypothetical protein
MRVSLPALTLPQGCSSLGLSTIARCSDSALVPPGGSQIAFLLEFELVCVLLCYHARNALLSDLCLFSD